MYLSKRITFNKKQFEIEGSGFRNKTSNTFKGTQKSRNKFPKTAVNVAVPFIGMAIGAESKHPKVGQATTYILESTTVGKILSLTDMYGSALRLKVI